MFDVKQDLNWEYIFTEEAISLEEKLASGEIEFSNKSRLCLALQHDILPWDKYKSWVLSHHSCAVLDSNLGPSDILYLNHLYQTHQLTLSETTDLGKGYAELTKWNNKTIFIGYNLAEELQTREDIIFYLCSPQILNGISDENNSESKINEALEQFENSHFENSQMVRKHYDAYIVLKISDNHTFFHKCDEDFAKEDIDHSIFKFNLKEDNIFSRAYKDSKVVDFSLSDLGLNILDFSHGTLTALKRGRTVMGFLLGLKTSVCEKEDGQVLEKISYIA